jgi:hypothetical protein
MTWTSSVVQLATICYNPLGIVLMIMMITIYMCYVSFSVSIVVSKAAIITLLPIVIVDSYIARDVVVSTPGVRRAGHNGCRAGSGFAALQ